MTGERIKVGAALIVAAGALAACGGEGTWTVDAPEGQRLLPDLAPLPPVDLHILHKDDLVELRFTSTLVNVGAGDFVLRGSRPDTDDPGAWTVEQEIPYSEAGSELAPTEAEMVWGGDGHEHWHVKRVAEYRLVPLDEAGQELEDGAQVDAKIGFCFFDSHREVADQGPDEAGFSHEQCGAEGDRLFRMGLSPGWGDVYSFALPGQSFDITTLPDGRYHLWAEADTRAWFEETSTENNVTWAILELSTLPEGLRAIQIAEVGPDPR